MKDTWNMEQFMTEPPDELVEFCQRQIDEARSGRSIEAALRVRNSLSGTYGLVLAHLLLTLARIYLIQRNYSEMLETIHIISVKKINDMDFFSRETGRILGKAGFFEASEAWFRKSLSESTIQEKYKYSEFLLGLHLVSEGSKKLTQHNRELTREGSELLQKSSEFFHTAEEAYELAAIIGKCSGESQKIIASKALETLQSVPVSKIDDLAFSLYSKAIFHEKLSDFKEAELCFKELSQLGKTSSIEREDVVIGLARLSMITGNLPKAIKRLKEGRRNPLILNHSNLILTELEYTVKTRKKSDITTLVDSISLENSIINSPQSISDAISILINNGFHEEASKLLQHLPKDHYTEPSKGIEIKLMLSDYLFDRDQDTATKLFLESLEHIKDECTQNAERIVVADYPVPWAFPEDFVFSTVSKFRNYFAANDREFNHRQKLAIGAILIHQSPRQARSLLRQAATSEEPLVQVTSLLLIGFTQLSVDPEVAYGTLINASNSHGGNLKCHPALYFILAQACENTGRYKSTYKYLLKAEEKAKPQIKTLIQASIGRHWLRKGEPLRALGLFRQAITHPVGCTWRTIESLRGTALEMAGDIDTAAHTYEVMKNSTDTLLKLHSILSLAGISARKGNIDEAINLINSYTDIPLNQRRLVSMLKGRIYQLDSRHKEAITELEESIWPTFAENPTSLKLLGLSYEETGHKDLAARCYLIALIEIEFSSRNSLPGEASTLPGLHIPELGKIQLPRLKEIQFLEQKIRHLAMFFVRDDSIRISEDDYNGVSGIKKAISILLHHTDVSIDKVYLLLSEIYSNLGRRKIYRECIRKADLARKERYTSLITSQDAQNEMIDNLERKPLSGGARLTEISAFFPSVKKKKSVSDYISYSLEDMRKMVNESDEKERSKRLFNLGNALFDQRKFDEAADKYSEALLCPKCDQDSEIRHNLGITLNELGEHKWAVECFQKAISSGNESLIPSCLYNMGNALLEQGKIKESLHSYQRCIEFKESSSDLWLHALINIAHCNERLGQRDKAKRCLLEALGKTRQPGWIMLRLAALEINGGDRSKASIWKKKAREEFMKKKDIFGISKLDEILRGVD